MSTILTNPLVSVLIPLYNAQKYISQCLDSVINQTYNNIEIIIIDDGSTDNSLSIVKEYEKKYSWIHVFLQKNSGSSVARNKAFIYSKGDYIQYLDADDYLHKDKIARQVEILDFKDKYTLVFGEHILIDGSNEKKQSLCIYTKNSYSSCELLKMMWLRFEVILVHSYLVHRSLIEKSGGWDETLTTNDDGEFLGRILTFSHSVVFDSGSIVYYRVDTPNSLSKRVSYESLFSIKKSINLYVEHSKKCKNDFNEALKTVYTVILMNMYPENEKIAKEMEFDKKEYGIEGYRYPKKTFLYSILFRLFGIKIIAILQSKLKSKLKSIIVYDLFALV